MGISFGLFGILNRIGNSVIVGVTRANPFFGLAQIPVQTISAYPFNLLCCQVSFIGLFLAFKYQTSNNGSILSGLSVFCLLLARECGMFAN